MDQLLMFIVLAVVFAVVVFAAAAFTLGRADGLSAPTPDAAPLALPADRLCGAEEVQDLRFDTALRGYRMGQVDAVLHRLAVDIEARDEQIRVLTARLDDAEVDPAAWDEAAADGAAGDVSRVDE